MARLLSCRLDADDFLISLSFSLSREADLMFLACAESAAGL